MLCWFLVSLYSQWCTSLIWWLRGYVWKTKGYTGQLWEYMYAFVIGLGGGGACCVAMLKKFLYSLQSLYLYRTMCWLALVKAASMRGTKLEYSSQRLYMLAMYKARCFVKLNVHCFRALTPRLHYKNPYMYHTCIYTWAICVPHNLYLLHWHCHYFEKSDLFAAPHVLLPL